MRCSVVVAALTAAAAAAVVDADEEGAAKPAKPWLVASLVSQALVVPPLPPPLPPLYPLPWYDCGRDVGDHDRFPACAAVLEPPPPLPTTATQRQPLTTTARARAETGDKTRR